MRLTLRTVLPLLALSAAAGLAAAQTYDESFGVTIFPGAEPQPEVARAIETYYTPALANGRRLAVGVFVTSVDFDQVRDFYTPRMEKGKRGWRQKTRALLHHTKTLEFLRAQELIKLGEGKELPAALRPLFGDPKLTQAEFESRLRQLLDENEGAEIRTVEGLRQISGDPEGGEVRVTIERPFMDLEELKLVDRTRIILIKTSRKG